MCELRGPGGFPLTQISRRPPPAHHANPSSPFLPFPPLSSTQLSRPSTPIHRTRPFPLVDDRPRSTCLLINYPSTSIARITDCSSTSNSIRPSRRRWRPRLPRRRSWRAWRGCRPLLIGIEGAGCMYLLVQVIYSDYLRWTSAEITVAGSSEGQRRCQEADSSRAELGEAHGSA